MRRTYLFLSLVLATLVWLAAPYLKSGLTRLVRGPSDLGEIRARVVPHLTQAMAQRGLEFGAPSFVRIFKEEAELEVWLQAGERYERFKTYPICNFSGALGPKLREGDHQSPEGFYKVTRAALNPNSRFHLSFNLGFPNTYDRAQGRTGSYLMVHGDCLSVGCYAMTDPAIEEIYLTIEAALGKGQDHVPVHAFPFRMSAARMARAATSPWHAEWQGLKAGFDLFEISRVPPQEAVTNGQYTFAAH